MRVTPEESKQVQEICFANDIYWNSGVNRTQNVVAKYLFINTLFMAYCDTEYYYSKDNKEEVDANLFIKTSGTCVEETFEEELKQNINKEETMIKTNIKMRVTPEQSEAVQKICFANGIFFNIAHDKISYTEAEYLFIERDKIWYRNYSDHNTAACKGYTEVDASLFIRTSGTCVKETTEQELKQNNNKEETMEKSEVKSYIDVKDYLITKGLYERVLEIDWKIYEEYTFSNLFMWSKTEEGHDFWDELNDEMLDLDIYDKVESLVQDYKAKQCKEFIKHIETQPEEVVETKPLEKPKQYLCYVQGKALPKHIHKTLEQAKQEAQRLCRKELTKVRVLEVVAEYEAEVLVKEVL